MRILVVLFALLLTAGVSAGVSADEQVAGKAESQSCLACHKGKLSLAGRGSDTLVEQIKAIRAGEKKHPPGLDKLSEDDLEAIAAYLDSAE